MTTTVDILSFFGVFDSIDDNSTINFWVDLLSDGDFVGVIIDTLTIILPRLGLILLGVIVANKTPMNSPTAMATFSPIVPTDIDVDGEEENEEGVSYSVKMSIFYTELNKMKIYFAKLLTCIR